MTARGLFICGCMVSLLCEVADSHQSVGAAPVISPAGHQAPQPAPAIGPATLVDQTPTELLQAMPELAGLEPAASQEILPEVLKNVGAKVELYFRSVVSTSAREQTIQEQIDSNGKVRETLKQTFRYLVIAHPEKGPLDFEEYRTDKEDRAASGLLRSDMLLTQRFVYVPVYLHPMYQEDSEFSYLGKQGVEGRQCYVVAFAQIPKSAHLKARFTEGLESYEILLQGVVWIDVSSFQIIRIYTKLLPDATVGNIRDYTTEVTYGEVRFKGIDVVFWLPREVLVNLALGDRGVKYRNYHRYSDYRLYTSQTKLIFK
jgi:hypothetical protein